MECVKIVKVVFKLWLYSTWSFSNRKFSSTKSVHTPTLLQDHSVEWLASCQLIKSVFQLRHLRIDTRGCQLKAFQCKPHEREKRIPTFLVTWKWPYCQLWVLTHDILKTAPDKEKDVESKVVGLEILNNFVQSKFLIGPRIKKFTNRCDSGTVFDTPFSSNQYLENSIRYVKIS